MNAAPPTEKDLLQALRFTTQDLAANRSGQLSDAQRQRLQAQQRRTLLLGSLSFFGFALLATIFLFLGQQNASAILAALGVVLVFSNALLIGLNGRTWMRLRADLRSDSVDALRGPLERVILRSRAMNNFVVRIAGAEFYVSKELFRCFQHERLHALYRTLFAPAPQCGTPENAQQLGGCSPPRMRHNAATRNT